MALGDNVRVSERRPIDKVEVMAEVQGKDVHDSPGDPFGNLKGGCVGGANPVDWRQDG